DPLPERGHLLTAARAAAQMLPNGQVLGLVERAEHVLGEPLPDLVTRRHAGAPRSSLRAAEAARIGSSSLPCPPGSPPSRRPRRSCVPRSRRARAPPVVRAGAGSWLGPPRP